VMKRKESHKQYEQFDPTSVGLPADFRLTKYSKLKG